MALLGQSALPGFHPCLACAAGAAGGLRADLAVLMVAEVGLLPFALAFGNFCLLRGTSTMFPTPMASASIVQDMHFAEAHSQGSGAESFSHALCFTSLQCLTIVQKTFNRLSDCKLIIDMNID